MCKPGSIAVTECNFVRQVLSVHSLWFIDLCSSIKLCVTGKRLQINPMPEKPFSDLERSEKFSTLFYQVWTTVCKLYLLFTTSKEGGGGNNYM